MNSFIQLMGIVIACALVPAIAAPNADNPPYVYDGVFCHPWGPAHSSWPEKLFWESTDTSTYSASRGSADGCEQGGTPAVMSAVSWGGEYVDGKPGGSRANDPGWKQFGLFMDARQQYFPLDANGNVWTFGGNPTGYISPAMPLDAADRPAGMQSAVWSDWIADKLGRLCAQTHMRGWFGADFIESIPHVTDRNIDFNPRIIDAFEVWAGVDVPGTTVAQRAAYIKDHYPARWNDYWVEAFAYWYGALGAKIKQLTGHKSLMCAQTHMYPSERRYMGTDFRVYRRYLADDEMYFQIELQSDGMRNVPNWGVTSVRMGQFACREPSVALGAHMDADLSDFWQAVGNTKPSMDSVTRREWGSKYLTHDWLSVGWTHVANRDGSVRRAPQAFLRGYWDWGTVDSTMAATMRAVKPRRPFGPACYYSVGIERKFEEIGEVWQATQDMEALWKSTACGYYVSDVALDSLKPASYPTAWIVFDKDSLPSSERAKLTAIAPILTDPASTAENPIRFSSGTSGFGFVDQLDRLIITATNVKTDNSATTAQISFAGARDGVYPVADLFNGSYSATLTIAGGSGSFSAPLTRWETRVFAVSGGIAGSDLPVVQRGVRGAAVGQGCRVTLAGAMLVVWSESLITGIRVMDGRGRTLKTQRAAGSVKTAVALDHAGSAGAVFVAVTTTTGVSVRRVVLR